MTTYFVTRHAGALQWANANQVAFDAHLSHLDDLSFLQQGDVVIGTLPINIVYQINQLGVRYVHLALQIPPSLRGVELDADELNAYKATLEEFEVSKIK